MSADGLDRSRRRGRPVPRLGAEPQQSAPHRRGAQITKAMTQRALCTGDDSTPANMVAKPAVSAGEREKRNLVAMVVTARQRGGKRDHRLLESAGATGLDASIDQNLHRP